MKRSQWRLGTAGICAAVLIACTAKDQSSKVDTGQAIAQDTSRMIILGGWPNPNVMLRPSTLERGKKTLRIHMDVPVPTIPQDLENAVMARKGHAALEIIKGTLPTGNVYSWAMLKAPLLCRHADLAHLDTQCTPRNAPSGTKGLWPNPDVLPLVDYSVPSHPGFLQIIMETKLKKASSGPLVQAALNSGNYGQVLKLLEADGAITAGKDSVAWATLKAAFKCTDYLPTEKTCGP